MKRNKQDYSVMQNARRYVIKVVKDAMEAIDQDNKIRLPKRECGVTVILFNEHKTTAEPFVAIIVNVPHITVANKIRYRIANNFVRNIGIQYLYMDNYSGMRNQPIVDIPDGCDYLKLTLNKINRPYNPYQTLYSYTSPHTGKIVMEYLNPDLKTEYPQCIRAMVCKEVKHCFSEPDDYSTIQIENAFRSVSKSIYNDPIRYTKEWYAFVKVYMTIYHKAPGAVKSSSVILDKKIILNNEQEWIEYGITKECDSKMDIQPKHRKDARNNSRNYSKNL